MTRCLLSWMLVGYLFISNLHAQSLLSSAGDYFQTSKFSLSWSLSEPVTETFSTSNYSFTQGFQQSKLEPVGKIDQKDPLTGAIEVYPNPTQGLVYVAIKRELVPSKQLPTHYLLYNIQGKQLTQGFIPTEPIILDLRGYTGAVFCLRLFNPDSDIQSTVIIQKIN